MLGLIFLILSSFYLNPPIPLPTPHEGAKGGRGGVLFISISQNKGQFFSLHILSYLITSDILPITDSKDGTAKSPNARIWAGSKSLESAPEGGCAVVCVRHPGRVFFMMFFSAVVRRQVFLAVAAVRTGLGPSHPHPLNGPYGTCRLRTPVLACWGVLHC